MEGRVNAACITETLLNLVRVCAGEKFKHLFDIRSKALGRRNLFDFTSVLLA